MGIHAFAFLLAATAIAPASSIPAPNPQIASVVKEISARNIEASIHKLAGFGTRHTLSETTNETRGIGAARRWLQSEFESYRKDSGGRLQVAMDEFTQPAGERNPQPVQVVNVVATLPGEQPESRDRIYVVSGHYDSRVSDPMNATGDAPGANDDASGAAAVLEIARVMAKYKFDATIVFMTVPGEEQGLLGSTHFAEQAKAKNERGRDVHQRHHRQFARRRWRFDDQHVRVFSEGVPPLRKPTRGGQLSAAKTIQRQPPTGALHQDDRRALRPRMKVILIYRRDRYGRGGDHQPFLERGFAAVRFTEPNENYHHQHQNVRIENGIQFGDLPEFDDFNYIAQVARINAASLGALAPAPATPSGVEMETKELTNDTTLRWEANREPDLAGYEVLWRETTSPLWQHAASTGNVTRYTVPKISKDNFLFGVAAIDRDGNRSPAVYPAPSVK